MRTIGWAALAAAAFAGTAAQAKGDLDATIVRTTYGIPHVSADSWDGIGYGVAYAYAQDNLCLLAEEFATVRGERSMYFGPEGKVLHGSQEVDNLSSDVFMRSVIDLPRLRAGASAQGPEANQLAAGYVAGYNRFLRDAGTDGIPAECRGKSWVKPITTDDMLRLTEKQMLLASAMPFLPAIANAAPPGMPSQASAMDLPEREDMGVGSNGWAFGGEATEDGRGLVIGNALPAAMPDGRDAGLSGPAVRPLALRCVTEVARAVPVDVVGAGGVATVVDARAYLSAGAVAVQVGSALFHDPTTAARLVAALSQEGTP